MSYVDIKSYDANILSKTTVIIDIMVRVLANGPGDQGSIPSQISQKTQKMVLDTSLLNTQHYKVWVKSNGSNPAKDVEPSPTPQSSGNWKRKLLSHLQLELANLLIFRIIYSF